MEENKVRLLFDKVLGIEQVSGLPVNRREAVRAICVMNGKLLMIQSNLGDCKLPGGGIEPGENHQTALKREIAEETGYTCTRLSPRVGEVIQRKHDMDHPERLFEMISYYYLCQIDGIQGKQNLDAYEQDLAFEPKWLDISEAIDHNQKYLSNEKMVDRWTSRENYVLKKLLEVNISDIFLKKLSV